MPMASFAHLSREERLGLGVAAVAHVALVAALVWQVRDDPTPLPIPERMTVSLADEVSLESTSPRPAAEPQPAAAPEPVAEPLPQPTRAVVQPSPTPRPTVRPSPRPTRTPAPTQTTPRRDFEDAFRPAADTPARPTNPGSPGTRFGPAEQASIEQAINRQLKPHWSAPQGVDAERLITVLRWELNPDGSLKGRPEVVSQSGITDSNRPQSALHAERAIRAVQLAAPFELPEEYYDKWKRIRTWRFDRRL
jgi:protein TonB